MKKFFARGLVALLPLVLTGFVLYLVFDFLYGSVGVPIGNALKWGARRFMGWTPEGETTAWFFAWGAPFLGFAFAIVLTFVMGFFAATFVGRRLYHVFDAALKRLPVVRVIYPYAKQFTDFFFSPEKKVDFKHAVAIPFPTYGVYSIGFVTGEGMRSLDEATRKHLLCVYVPTSPTPFTGYVCYVPREDVIPLPVSVEEAMRIVITMGVVHPAHQAVSSPSPAAPGTHAALPEPLERALTRDPAKPA
ncbi:MAG TPA: DUF502 domain-containing protein [Planctomycetota bacterium]|jgi:uncharacterized membrane protein|nr:DUF502 domain-containing protein [Planctomycetota bacterium]